MIKRLGWFPFFCVPPHCSVQFRGTVPDFKRTRRHFWVYQTITLGEVAFKTLVEPRRFLSFLSSLLFLFLFSHFSIIVLRILCLGILQTVCTSFSLHDRNNRKQSFLEKFCTNMEFLFFSGFDTETWFINGIKRSREEVFPEDRILLVREYRNFRRLLFLFFIDHFFK